MADYIDREVLRTYMIAGISLAETFNIDGCLDDKINAYKECLNVVDGDMPSVDAVEVIRCRDCKYKVIKRNMILCSRLVASLKNTDYEPLYIQINDDDYCKWGEKNE